MIKNDPDIELHKSYILGMTIAKALADPFVGATMVELGLRQDDLIEFYKWQQAVGIPPSNRFFALQNPFIVQEFFTRRSEGKITADTAIELNYWITENPQAKAPPR